jgi:hypothetical protein
MNLTLSHGNNSAFGVAADSLSCDRYHPEMGRWGGINCSHLL